MPEGDTIHRAARRLNAALAGREMELRRRAEPALAASPPRRRAAGPHARARRGARQAPARPLLGRPRPPQPPRDERALVDRRRRPAALRQALAACSPSGRVDRRADRRQAAAPGQRVAGCATTRCCASSARTRCAPGFDVAEAAAAPARAGRRARDRRGAARPADRRRGRQRDPQRGLLRARVSPWRAVDELGAEQARAPGRRDRADRCAPRSPRAGARGRSTARRATGCPACGGRVSSRGQGDDNRTAYWCARCQT